MPATSQRALWHLVQLRTSSTRPSATAFLITSAPQPSCISLAAFLRQPEQKRHSNSARTARGSDNRFALTWQPQPAKQTHKVCTRSQSVQTDSLNVQQRRLSSNFRLKRVPPQEQSCPKTTVKGASEAAQIERILDNQITHDRRCLRRLHIVACCDADATFTDGRGDNT